MESRQDIENPSEIKITVLTTRERDLGSARPGTAEKFAENPIK